MAKKPTAIRLDENLLKQLKIITIENGTSIQKIVEAFLIEYAEKHSKK